MSTMSPTSLPVRTTLCRWIGRLLALAVALFWAAFLFEHVGEWLLTRGQPWPPGWVVASVGFHALMVVGLVLATWKTGPGLAILALGTLGFLALTGLWRAVWIPLFNALPAVLLLIGSRRDPHIPQNPPNLFKPPQPADR
jgi:hypothetical protein